MLVYQYGFMCRCVQVCRDGGGGGVTNFPLTSTVMMIIISLLSYEKLFLKKKEIS